MKSAARFFILGSLLLLSSSVAVSQWEWVGGVNGMFFNSVGVVHGRVYLASGGPTWTQLSVSSDRGGSWMSSPQFLGPCAHRFGGARTGNDSIVFITGCYGSTVLLRSTDGGMSWAPADSGLGQQEVLADRVLAGSSPNMAAVIAAVAIDGCICVHRRWTALDALRVHRFRRFRSLRSQPRIRSCSRERPGAAWSGLLTTGRHGRPVTPDSQTRRSPS